LRVLQHQAEALVKLREKREFQTLMEMLATRAEELNTMLIMKDDARVDLIRGELRAYAQIQDALMDAPNVLAKFERGYIEEHADGAP